MFTDDSYDYDSAEEVIKNENEIEIENENVNENKHIDYPLSACWLSYMSVVRLGCGAPERVP